MRSLSAMRSVLYPYTRPIFAIVGVGAAGLANGGIFELPQRIVAAESPTSWPTSALELAASGAQVAVGVAGIRSIMRGQGRIIWMSHSYERWAWGIAFGSLPIAAAASAYETLYGGDRAHVLLTPAAGGMLAATLGERLGSKVGLVSLPALAGVGLASAAAAIAGDPRGERVAGMLQRTSLLLLPALHVCLPVYTMSAQGALGLTWFWMAAAAPTLEDTRVGQNLFLTFGSASLLCLLRCRNPVCSF